MTFTFKYLIALHLECCIPRGIISPAASWSGATGCTSWTLFSYRDVWLCKSREASDICLMWRRKAGGILCLSDTVMHRMVPPCGAREGIKRNMSSLSAASKQQRWLPLLSTFSPSPFVLPSPSLPSLRLLVCVPDRVWKWHHDTQRECLCL